MTSADPKSRVVSIATGWLLLKPRLISGDALAMPVQSYYAKFKDEFHAHIKREGCWFPEHEVAPTGNTFWEDHV